MESDDIKEYVILTHGHLSPLAADSWANAFNNYISKHQNEIDKIYAAVTAVYSPLDNNDVTTETVVLNKSDGVTMTPSAAKNSEYTKSYDAGLENTSYNSTEIISAAESTPHNTLSETFQSDQVAGYNSTSKTLERKHGNISSVTNQSIITQEIELRLIEWLHIIIDKAVMFGGVYFAN